MGVDFLDLCFRLEKKIGVRLDKGWIDFRGEKTPAEWTVHYMEEMFIRAVRSKFAARERAVWTDGDFECIDCHFKLEATPVPGFCRRCGTPLSVDQYLALVFRRCLSETAMVPETKIYPEALVIKDLGFG